MLKKPKITPNDLKEIGFKTNYAQIYKNLKQARAVLTTVKERWIAQGPAPENSPLKSFLNDKHQHYLQVGKEEFYNRLYLDEPNFLVGDQLFPSDIEKVELWDLLYYGEVETLYLYHVKGGFNQHARDACSQILVSAQNLRAELSTKDYPRLKKIYHHATKPEGSSAFRQRVAELYGKFTQEEFIELFRKCKKMVFVYGVLDDSDGAERLLSEEQDIEKPFERREFAAWPREVIASLKQTNYLDSEMRITSKFLRCSEKEFSKDRSIPLDVEEKKKVFRLLSKRDTHFNSIIAKLELINLTIELRKLGFCFNIVQISRGQATSPLRATNPPPPRMEVQKSLFDYFREPKRVKRTEIPGCPGINNRRNDCFLISAFQMLLHSDYYEILKGECLNEDWSEEFSHFQHHFEDTNRVEPLTVHQFRELLNFDETTQEDAEEAITRILGHYDSTQFASKIKSVRGVNLAEAVPLNRTDEEHSSLNGEGEVETEEAMVLLPLPLESGTFQSLINHYFQKKEINQPYTFTYEDELYQTQHYEEECIPQELRNTLLFSLKRFDAEGNKLKEKVDFEEGTYLIGDQQYHLHSFIVHEGETRENGHYFTYCREGEGWLCYDDAAVKRVDEEEVFLQVQNAYVVMVFINN